MATTVNERRILVGVDGSEPSKHALRWAIEQARLTGATVDAVSAWAPETAMGWAAFLDTDQLIKTSAQLLTDAVAEVAGHHPTVPIRTRVVERHAAQVLIQEAEGAQLLVLGSCGHGGFAGALLGSVSQYCVHHAPCPVVILRERPNAR